MPSAEAIASFLGNSTPVAEAKPAPVNADAPNAPDAEDDEAKVIIKETTVDVEKPVEKTRAELASERFARALSREKAARAREASATAKEAEAQKLLDEAKAQGEKYRKIREGNPLDGLKESGLSYEELTKAVLNGTITPEAQMRLDLEEMKAWRKERDAAAEADKKARADAEAKATLEQSTAAEVESLHGFVKMVGGNAHLYPTIFSEYEADELAARAKTCVQKAIAWRDPDTGKGLPPSEYTDEKVAEYLELVAIREIADNEKKKEARRQTLAELQREKDPRGSRDRGSSGQGPQERRPGSKALTNRLAGEASSSDRELSREERMKLAASLL